MFIGIRRFFKRVGGFALRGTCSLGEVSEGGIQILCEALTIRGIEKLKDSEFSEKGEDVEDRRVLRGPVVSTLESMYLSSLVESNSNWSERSCGTAFFIFI